LAISAVIIIIAAALGATYVLSDKEELSVVYLNKSSYEALIVADKKGFFDELSFKLGKHTVAGSGQNAVDTMLAGSADIAATGEGPAINAMNKCSDDIIILCSYDISTSAQIWVAQKSLIDDGKIIVEDNGPEEVAGYLKGSKFKVGIIEGSSTEAMFKRWCDEYDVTYEGTNPDLNLKYLTGNTLASSFAEGEIDILAGSQPYPATVMEKSEAVAIGSSEDIGVRSTSVLITTKDNYEKKAEKMKEFVAAIKKATDYMNDNKEEVVDICASSIEWSKAAQNAVLENSTPRVAFNESVIKIMYTTSEGKGFENRVTRDMISASCPLKEYIRELYGE